MNLFVETSSDNTLPEVFMQKVQPDNFIWRSSVQSTQRTNCYEFDCRENACKICWANL